MRKVLPLFAIFLTACPEQVGQQCPAHTVALGQYAINFAGQHPTGECQATQADGGSPTPVAREDAGTSFGALCYGTADGGQQIWLVIPNKGVRSSDLADGGFHFVSHTDPVQGTACVCAVGIDETFDGYLTTTPPGLPFAQSDGGIPSVTGLTGAIVDTLSTPSGTTGCQCALPCGVTYAITGTRQ